MAESSVPIALATPTDLRLAATIELATHLNEMLANIFVLYMKTKNFHWHMSGPHFRDYHLMLDEQSDQIFEMTDTLAERVRKLGHLTLHSIGEIAIRASLKDSNAPYLAPPTMLEELRNDNFMLAQSMRMTHGVAEAAKDIGTSSLLEVYADETERRVWFLFEAGQMR